MCHLSCQRASGASFVQFCSNRVLSEQTRTCSPSHRSMQANIVKRRPTTYSALCSFKSWSPSLLSAISPTPVTLFQWCGGRATPTEHAAQACVHTLLAVVVVLVCIACMNTSSVQRKVSFWPLSPPGASGHACSHTCTSWPHHCLQVLSLGLDPPGCRSGLGSTFLVGCVCSLPLTSPHEQGRRSEEFRVRVYETY